MTPAGPSSIARAQRAVAAGRAVGVEAGRDRRRRPAPGAAAPRRRPAAPSAAAPASRTAGAGTELGGVALERAGDRRRRRGSDRAPPSARDRAGAHDERRRRALAQPEAGAAQPGRAPPWRRRLAGRAELALELGAERSRRRAAGRRGRRRRGPPPAAAASVAKQVVEGDDAPGLGRRHGQAPADVVERPFAHPADAVLDGVEGGQQQVRAARAPPGRRARARPSRAMSRARALPAGGWRRRAARRPRRARRRSGSAPRPGCPSGALHRARSLLRSRRTGARAARCGSPRP